MGGTGGTIPGHRVTMGASNQCGGRRMTAGLPKSPNNVTSTLFNTVHLFPKDLRYEQGGTKLASCPGRHPISLRLQLIGTAMRVFKM